MNKRNVLSSLLLQLEDDAVAVLLAQAQRMVAGRKAYGDLDIAKDGRDWTEEALQEYLDGSNYLAIELIKLRRMLGRAR